MKIPTLYRKRLIPEECVHLKDDVLLYRDEELLITKWNTLKPKKDLHHGYSCYFLNLGIKISKFYDQNNQFLHWYCDIVEHTYESETDTYVFTDLLADVIIEPDGFVKVVDLEELSDALEAGLLATDQLTLALRSLSGLLNLIYSKKFAKLVEPLERFETVSR